MNEDAIRALVTTWHERMTELTLQSESFETLTGAQPESPLIGAIWHVAGGYTEAVDGLCGGGGWLSWFWLECDLGNKSKDAMPHGGKWRHVKTTDDLVALILEDHP